QGLRDPGIGELEGEQADHRAGDEVQREEVKPEHEHGGHYSFLDPPDDDGRGDLLSVVPVEPVESLPLSLPSSSSGWTTSTSSSSYRAPSFTSDPTPSSSTRSTTAPPSDVTRPPTRRLPCEVFRLTPFCTSSRVTDIRPPPSS